MGKTTIGLLTVELLIPGADSLKTKRQVVKSLKDRLSTRFNVSVAEVAGQDKWQRTVLAVCIVGNDSNHLQKNLQKVLQLMAHNRQAEIINSEIEYL